MSEIKVNQVNPRVASGTVTFGASGDSLSIPSGVTLTNNGTITNSGTLNGFGKIANVTAWTFTSTVVVSATSATDVTGYSLNYTPASSSNTIAILGQVQYSAINTDQTTPQANFEFYRDGSATGIDSLLNRIRAGNTAENHQIYMNVPLIGQDSPATASQVTYTLRAWTNTADIEVEYLSAILFEVYG